MKSSHHNETQLLNVGLLLLAGYVATCALTESATSLVAQWQCGRGMETFHGPFAVVGLVTGDVGAIGRIPDGCAIDISSRSGGVWSR